MVWEPESGRKYSKDERIWHIINQVISLKDDHIKRNNFILRQVLDEVIDFLKGKDLFFRDYFREIVFAGSYYKGTKVGSPDEFDLNLVIRLPVDYGSIKFEEDIPGYVKLKLCNDSFLPNWENHKKLLTKWLSVGWFSTDPYLRHDKFRQWMEGLFSYMPKKTKDGYQMRVSKSGPAFTLTVSGSDLSYPISVDLVPVLEFDSNTGLSNRPAIKPTWHAVPKPLEPNLKMPEVQWRISRYTSEKAILRKYENGYMKPVIRQLKKLRDKYHLNFASYYIETMCLTQLDYTSQRMGSTQLFIYMLAQMMIACESHEILNYWDSRHNLIQMLPKEQLVNMAGLLRAIIKKVTAEPLTVADVILTDDELKKVRRQIYCIKTGEAYADIPNEPLELEDNSSWCSIQ